MSAVVSDTCTLAIQLWAVAALIVIGSIIVSLWVK
jgi:hypothetical protein